LRAGDAGLLAVREQVLERLPLLLIEPQQILDLGCWGAEHLAALAVTYPDADVTGLEFGANSEELKKPVAKGSENSRWLSRFSPFAQKPVRKMTSGDPHNLAFPDSQFDLVVSNLCLPFCQKPNEVFTEVARVLKPGGAFLFSSLGPDTLMEYRQRWATVDTYPHVSGLIDMHDLGDAMLKAGLSDPVLDRDALNLDYPSVEALENELQVHGLVNSAHGRRKGLMSASAMSRVRDLPSRFTVGLELVHGHAWKTEFSTKRNSTNDEYKFPVSELQGSWKR